MYEDTKSNWVVRFGAFQVDLRAGELRKSGVRIKLQEQPFQVLAALLERPGEVVTRDDLRQRLWSDDTYVDFDRSLNIAVAKIREALGDSPSHPRFIETLPRRGYRFVYPVAGTGGQPPSSQAAARSDEKELAAATVLVSRKGVLAAGIALAAMVAVAIGITFGVGEESSRVVTSEALLPSIAVLPLENLSGAPEQEYFVDGLTDMLITDLGTISTLRVISRTSVMQYKGAQRPLPDIARELDVSHLIEGTVLREGDQVRIGLRLMEAAGERQIWGQSYERPLRQVLTLQREIARAVADAVLVKLDPTERARLDRSEAVSPEALDAYLRGLDVMYDPKKGGMPKAVEYFEQAIERSPNYALAYVSLAIAYVSQAFGPAQLLTSAEAELKARQALNKALEIDETLAGAHSRLGDLRRSFHYDWEGAEASYRRSIELNPNDWYCHMTYAFFLTEQGRPEEAMREATLARRLAPHSPMVQFLATLPLNIFRDSDKHISELQSLLETELGDWQLPYVRLGEAYLHKGMHDEALAAFRRAQEISDDNLTLASLGRAYGVVGRKREARDLLDELLARSKKQPVSSDHFAIIYLGLGELERAMDALEQAYDERAPGLTYLRVEPIWDPLRTHPRFQALLRKMNFPE